MVSPRTGMTIQRRDFTEIIDESEGGKGLKLKRQWPQISANFRGLKTKNPKYPANTPNKKRNIPRSVLKITAGM
jgi:hypothetical protein